MDVYYIIAKNDQKYYYRDGKRITEEEGKKLKATKKSSSPKKSSSSKKSPKKCPSGKIENPATGKCVNKDGAIGKAILGKKSSSPKKSSSSKKSPKKCPSGKIENPATGKCVNKDGAIGKAILGKKSPKKSPKKSSSSNKCPSGKIENPATGKCVNKDGKIGKAILGKKSSSPKKSPKKSTPKRKKSRVPCKSHQERNEKTGRCINKSDYKRKRSLVRDPVSRENRSKRWSRVKKVVANCVKRSNLELRDLQIKVVEYMEIYDGFLVVHGTGCGKTLTSLACSQCYLDKYPERGVVFVGPASLTSNFKKEMKAYGVKNTKKYDFYSYDKFLIENNAGRPVSLKNKFLIVDEAHNIRNPKSLKSIALVNAALQADKRLLLTATPFVNSMTDFIPLINMIYGKMIVGTKSQFYSKVVDEWLGKEVNEESLATFRYLLQDKVDMVDCKNKEDFPERIDNYVDVPMTEDYYDKYVKLVTGEGIYDIIFSEPKRFYHGYRRAVNKTGKEYFSRKIETAVPIFKKGKSIIFTNWVEFGIDPIKEALDKNGITYTVFSGDVPVEQRQQIVNDFNNNMFNVLILTRAGGEGIDLKGVRSVVVLDPTWNDAGLQQVIGRAIRFRSHAHLPIEERNVNVYFMMLTKPETISEEDAYASGDKILYAIIEKKKKISAVLLELLKDLSI
jgi:superfamily II DNA or RNA helicase